MFVSCCIAHGCTFESVYKWAGQIFPAWEAGGPHTGMCLAVLSSEGTVIWKTRKPPGMASQLYKFQTPLSDGIYQKKVKATSRMNRDVYAPPPIMFGKRAETDSVVPREPLSLNAPRRVSYALTSAPVVWKENKKRGKMTRDVLLTCSMNNYFYLAHWCFDQVILLIAEKVWLTGWFGSVSWLPVIFTSPNKGVNASQETTYFHSVFRLTGKYCLPDKCIRKSCFCLFKQNNYWDWSLKCTHEKNKICNMSMI